jgi:hypothetical protein
MRLNEFRRWWIAGAFALALPAMGIGQAQTKSAAPTITVYQDPT